ncbi:hypothetical protein HUB98_06515 [Paenibacillus barcinonensis]|uniref:Sad1/UNC-like protein n=1 Tax=Paenibacillus barcinonensis TaxID=198119 RepID=A0A2V4WHP4_PAEBA|nr:SPRY domain-containing protein [Paenibacillus barcinonensis]PYE51670.1 Sad1/UNC-like protein [Paenibacillus barcinonensis]QKS56030.1 hypothetical protein HUB98_06515 [Paenibacillus barcinonensis]
MIDVFNVTLNPSDMGPSNTLSNGNLTVVSTAGNTSVRATHGRSSKKWYFETKIDSGSNSIGIGISNKNMPVNSNILSNMNQRLYYCANGNKYPDAVLYSEASAIGDVVGVLIDLDNGALEFRRNNKSLGISNTDIKTLGEIYPFVLSGIATSKSVTFNFGATPFKYPLPIGYNSYDGKQLNSSKFLIVSGDKYYSVPYVPKETAVPIQTAPSTKVFSSPLFQNSVYFAYRAFDGIDSVTPFLGAGTNGFLGYEFDEPIIIRGYAIKSYVASNSDLRTAVPKDWTFEGSNDGANWTVLDARVNQIWSIPATEEKEFAINPSNQKSFKFYRINWTTNNGYANYTAINELKMYKSSKLIECTSITDRIFGSYGMNKNDSIDLNDELISRQIIETNYSPLGSGKVFRQKIDTTKIPIKKASIT